MSPRASLTMLLIVSLAFCGMTETFAAPPPNPPTDPHPFDLHPYPPTDAILYYDRDGGYLAGDFTLDIGGGVVEIQLVPKDLEDYAVGYYTEFWPGMPVSDALKAAINQWWVGYLWPRWLGEPAPPYTPGEEANYLPGWRFYYEDMDWDANAWDRDIDDLWIDVVWHKVGSQIWIFVTPSLNEAIDPNPFEITFQRKSGSAPVHFSYVLDETSSGGAVTSGVFALEDDPVTIRVFDSGDVRDWALFSGTVPLVPAAAMPCGLVACAFIARRRMRGRR